MNKTSSATASFMPTVTLQKIRTGCLEKAKPFLLPLKNIIRMNLQQAPLASQGGQVSHNSVATAFPFKATAEFHSRICREEGRRHQTGGIRAISDTATSLSSAVRAYLIHFFIPKYEVHLMSSFDMSSRGIGIDLTRSDIHFRLQKIRKLKHLRDSRTERGPWQT